MVLGFDPALLLVCGESLVGMCRLILVMLGPGCTRWCEEEEHKLVPMARCVRTKSANGEFR